MNTSETVNAFREVQDSVESIQLANPQKIMYYSLLIFASVVFVYFNITWKYWKDGMIISECQKWNKSTQGDKTHYECTKWGKGRRRWPLVLGLLCVLVIAGVVTKNVVFFTTLLLNPRLLRLYYLSWVVGVIKTNVF